MPSIAGYGWEKDFRHIDIPKEASLTGKIGSALGEFKNQTSLPLKSLGLVRNIANAAVASLKRPIPLIKTIKATKYLSLVTVPCSVWELCNAGRDFAKAQNNSERLDAGLTAVSEVSSLMDSAVTLAQGMAEVGVVAQTSLAWVTPVSIVAVVLSVSSIVLTIRGLYQTCHFRYELRGKTDQEILEHILAKDEAFLKRQFKVEGGKLKGQLQRIHDAAQLPLGTHARRLEIRDEDLRKTVSTLKGRVTDRIVGQSLSLVSSHVSLVGIGLLMGQPQLAPVGFGLMAVSSTVTIGSIIYEKVRKHQFGKALKN